MPRHSHHPPRKKQNTKNKILKGHGAHFVTMVCHSRKHTLSRIENHQVNLTSIGRIVEKSWIRIPDRFDQVKLGEYVLMPDHFHGIIHINPKSESEKISLGEVVHWFKTWSSNEYYQYGNQIGINPIGKLWQRGYNERRIPRGPSINLIKKYILENPLKWPIPGGLR